MKGRREELRGARKRANRGEERREGPTLGGREEFDGAKECKGAREPRGATLGGMRGDN
jgi:hypothetical protein